MRRYFAGSLMAAVAVVWHAFITREQFFPSMVYLSNSKLSVAVLGNLGFAVALGMYRLLTWTFLGRLRDSEVERINDKVGQAVIETLLAMTIFRQDFTAAFFAAFVVLSFVKIFHWMVQDRVDFIETTPNVTRGQHARIVAFIALLIAADVALLRAALASTLAKGVSISLLFAFEYAIQASTAVCTLAKYALSVADMATEGRWEGKAVAVFYLNLTLDLLHLITYTAFFAAVFTTYGIPIHLVRDLYWTFRNFQTRVRDFLRYRRVAANMDRRFPDATPEDLERAGHTCIVCREEMGPGARAKRLDCSHTFHLHCLRSWLERQQNCPICRAPVLAAQRRRPEAAPAAPAAAAPPRGRPEEDPAEFAFAAQRAEIERQQAELVDHLQAEYRRLEMGPGGDGGGGGEGLRRRRAPDGQPLPEGAPDPGDWGLDEPWRQPLQPPPQQGFYQQHPYGVAAGAAPAGAPAAAYVQHYPQWVATPPMGAAMVLPTAAGAHPVQFAGQLTPEAAGGAAAAAASPLPHGVVPVIPVPILIPLMAPPFGGGGGGGGDGGTPQQQHTPEQHMMASAIAAAATAAAMMSSPMMMASPMVAVAPPPPGAPTAAPPQAPTPPPQPRFDLAADESSAGGSGEGSAAAPAPAPAPAPAAADAPAAPAPAASEPPQAPTLQPAPSPAADDDAEEVRRRRLERFQAAANM